MDYEGVKIMTNDQLIGWVVAIVMWTGFIMAVTGLTAYTFGYGIAQRDDALNQIQTLTKGDK